jgi:hypothetical protein
MRGILLFPDNLLHPGLHSRQGAHEEAEKADVGTAVPAWPDFHNLHNQRVVQATVWREDLVVVEAGAMNRMQSLGAAVRKERDSEDHLQLLVVLQGRLDRYA